MSADQRWKSETRLAGRSNQRSLRKTESAERCGRGVARGVGKLRVVEEMLAYARVAAEEGEVGCNKMKNSSRDPSCSWYGRNRSGGESNA